MDGVLYLDRIGPGRLGLLDGLSPPGVSDQPGMQRRQQYARVGPLEPPQALPLPLLLLGQRAAGLFELPHLRRETGIAG